MLGGHLSRGLGQIATLGGMEALDEGVISEYQGPWQLAAYREPSRLGLLGSLLVGPAADDSAPLRIA